MSFQRRTFSLLSCTALTMFCACETSHTPAGAPHFDQPEKVQKNAPNSDEEKGENKSSKKEPSGEDFPSTLPSASNAASEKSKIPDADENKDVFPGVVPESVDDGGFQEIRSDLERDQYPAASYKDMRHMLTANNDLGFDLMRSITDAKSGNIAISPVSIHAAMGLLLSAATDQTLEELIAGNGFLDDVEQTHASLSRISMQLAALEQKGSSDKDSAILKMANRVFIRSDGEPKEDYLDVLAKYYGTGTYLVDFAKDREAARQAINQWVMDRTQSRIENLLPEGSVLSSTQWVLVNALYFKAPWGAGTFEEKHTKPASFRLQDGQKISVPMMWGEHEGASRGEFEDYSWGAIPQGTRGNTVAAFIKPKTGKFDKVLSKLSSAQVETSFKKADDCQLQLKVPKFKIETGSQNLIPFYKDRGVMRVFGDGAKAQLGGIGLHPNTKLETLVHSVFFAMDEKGVEAAAATAGVGNPESDEGPKRCDPLTLDEPFIFLVYDKRSQLVLFAGRVMNPKKS